MFKCTRQMTPSGLEAVGFALIGAGMALIGAGMGCMIRAAVTEKLAERERDGVWPTACTDVLDGIADGAGARSE